LRLYLINPRNDYPNWKQFESFRWLTITGTVIQVWQPEADFVQKANGLAEILNYWRLPTVWNEFVWRFTYRFKKVSLLCFTTVQKEGTHGKVALIIFCYLMTFSSDRDLFEEL